METIDRTNLFQQGGGRHHLGAGLQILVLGCHQGSLGLDFVDDSLRCLPDMAEKGSRVLHPGWVEEKFGKPADAAGEVEDVSWKKSRSRAWRRFSWLISAMEKMVKDSAAYSSGVAQIRRSRAWTCPLGGG